MADFELIFSENNVLNTSFSEGSTSFPIDGITESVPSQTTIIDVRVDGQSVVTNNVANITMPTIPTKVSDLTNDSGFITSSALTDYATKTWVENKNYITSNDLLGYATQSWVNSNYSSISNTCNRATVNFDNNDNSLDITLRTINNESLGTFSATLPFSNVIVNGRYDQATTSVVLIDKSGTEHSIDISSILTGVQPEITSTNKLSSDLVDDTNHVNKFVTSSKLQDITANTNARHTHSNLEVLETITSIPTKTSDLTNDSGFIDKEVNNLTNYTKTSSLGNAAFQTIDNTSTSISSRTQNSVVSGVGINTYVTSSLSTHNSSNVAHSDIRQTISDNYDTLSGVDTQLANDLTSEATTRASADTSLNTSITNEATTRASAVSNLQSQIDALESRSDVVDIVETHQALLNYDTSKLSANDVVKVLHDETQDDATSYYRWKTTQEIPTLHWVWLGSVGPFYTKTETGNLFVPQSRTVNNKSLSTNISLTAEDVGADTSGTATSVVASHNSSLESHSTLFNTKVDKVSGKGLSTNDYIDADKTKLAGIEIGAQVNIQSDWDQTSTTDDDYIKNKPTKLSDFTNDVVIQSDWNQTSTTPLDYIKNKPTKLSDFTNDVVKDAVLTIQKDGDTVGTFSANSSQNKTINIEQEQSDWNQTTTTGVDYIKNKPTNVSAFTNDVGYLTQHQSLADYSTTTQMNTAIANHHDSTKYDASNPQGYTSNTGTVTSVAVSMNGSTKGTVTTSGTIDLGTVITDISGKADVSTVNAISSRVTTIEGKIPSQATSSNKLADKDFVNSSISTNTANYISNNGQPFTSVAQLEAYTGTVTNNDYAFVTGIDESGNTYFDRYKATVSGNNVTWAKEYRLNNSSFTAAQWSSINSTITSSKVGDYDSHLSNTTIHVTTNDKTTWTNKYDKPSGGIPENDLTTDVQGKLCTGISNSDIDTIWNNN